MGVQWEVEVPPELLNGTAAPVLKHMQVGAAAELYGAEKRAGERERPGPCPAARLEEARWGDDAQATAARAPVSLSLRPLQSQPILPPTASCSSLIPTAWP